MTNELRYKIASIILSCETIEQWEHCKRFITLGENWAEQEYLFSMFKLKGLELQMKAYEPVLNSFKRLCELKI